MSSYGSQSRSEVGCLDVFSRSRMKRGDMCLAEACRRNISSGLRKDICLVRRRCFASGTNFGLI